MTATQMVYAANVEQWRGVQDIEYIPLMALFPGLFIFLTVLSINYIGDGLRDMLDPNSAPGSQVGVWRIFLHTARAAAGSSPRLVCKSPCEAGAWRVESPAGASRSSPGLQRGGAPNGRGCPAQEHTLHPPGSAGLTNA